jgi:hypothetical protein
MGIVLGRIAEMLALGYGHVDRRDLDVTVRMIRAHHEAYTHTAALRSEPPGTNRSHVPWSYRAHKIPGMPDDEGMFWQMGRILHDGTTLEDFRPLRQEGVEDMPVDLQALETDHDKRNYGWFANNGYGCDVCMRLLVEDPDIDWDGPISRTHLFQVFDVERLPAGRLRADARTWHGHNTEIGRNRRVRPP